MYQYYIVEIQQDAAGEYSHLVHYAWDEDPAMALLKGESKYYQVLSAAAVSTLKRHSAIMFGTDGVPVMYKTYVHNTEEPEPVDPEPVEPDEPVEPEE